MRSTEDKLIHIPLNVGMNQAVSPRLAPTGTLYSVQNCRTSGNGVLEQRPGTTALTGTTAQNASHSLQNDGGVTTNVEAPAFACQVQSALLVGNTFGDAFAFSTVWQFQGRFSTCLPVRKRYGLSRDDLSLNGDGFGTNPPDVVVTASGYICVAAITALGTLHCYIEDPNGVRIWYLADSGSTYVRVRLTAQSDVVYLVTQVGTSISVSPLTIVTGAVTTGAPVVIGVLTGAGSSWDVSNYSTTVWFLAYHSAAAVVTLKKLSGTTVPNSTSFAVVASPKLTLWANPIEQQLWVGCYDNAVDVRFNVWDVSSTIIIVKALTTLLSAANLGPPMFGRFRQIAANTTALKSAFYCFGLLNSGTGVATYVGIAFGSASAPSTPQPVWHVYPVSKPDNYNRVWCIHQTGFGNQLLTKTLLLRFVDVGTTGVINAPPTIELSTPNAPQVGFAITRFASSWFVGSGGLGPSSSFMPVLNTIQQFYTGAATSVFDLYEYTTAEQEPHRGSNRNGISTIITGQPVEFFGQSMGSVERTVGAATVPAYPAGASEIGFPHAPVVAGIIASNSGTLATSLVAGTRSWRFTYEWVDQYGRRHQSAPSQAVSLAVTGAAAGQGSATITVTTTDITQRQAANSGLRAYLKTYRTVAGGTEYHECASTQIAFDQTDGQITVADGEADSDIAQSGFLYTDGGVLDDTLAPSCRFLCKSEDRVWFGGLWDANIIQCSKVIVPGEPIQCTDDASFQVQLPGACTGLAYMDGNVVAFTEDAIYLVGGDGPNDQGQGSFQAPRCVTRSLGCFDYRSIVETNIGILFQSNLGFYLLPRGFGPAQYIGAAVQDEMAPTNFAANVATVFGAAAQITRGNHLARFLVGQNGAASTSTVLVYDIDSNQWFKDTLPAAASEMGAYDSLVQTGTKGASFVRQDLSTATSTTPVFTESDSATNDLDGTVAVQQVVKTAWIHPFGLGGWGKVNCVMVAMELQLGSSSTQLQLTINTDNHATQTGAWTITDFGNVSYRMLVISDDRACSAIQIQATCASADPAVLGHVKFISFTLEVEPTAGIRLLSDAEKN